MLPAIDRNHRPQSSECAFWFDGAEVRDQIRQALGPQSDIAPAADLRASQLDLDVIQRLWLNRRPTRGKRPHSQSVSSVQASFLPGDPSLSLPTRSNSRIYEQL
jgi:hypothetical protein